MQVRAFERYISLKPLSIMITSATLLGEAHMGHHTESFVLMTNVQNLL